MTDSEFIETKEAFGRLLDALPKAKKMASFNDACCVEIALNDLYRGQRTPDADSNVKEIK